MNDIVKPNNGAIEKPSFDLPESIADFDANDLRLSNIFICQDQSRDARDAGIQSGMLFDSITLEAYERIEAIMFYSFTTRILYGINPGDEIRCYSQDGKTPSAPGPIHNNCVDCPEHIKPAGSDKRYGDCNRTINFACIFPNLEFGDEKDFPFVVPMQRTNTPTAKKILNLAVRRRQELYVITRTIEVVQKTNDKGRFYGYSVSDGEKISDADIERAKYHLSFMKTMIKAQSFDVMATEEKNVTPPSNKSENETTPSIDVPF